jgi:molybdopterin-containing oxidoreductase family membrane subunit
MPQEQELLDRQPETPKEILGHGYTFDGITNQISNLPLKGKMPLMWYGCIAAGLALTGVLGLVVVLLFAKGVGIWGIRIPVGWGWAITNFVWWIGIGHA